MPFQTSKPYPGQNPSVACGRLESRHFLPRKPFDRPREENSRQGTRRRKYHACSNQRQRSSENSASQGIASGERRVMHGVLDRPRIPGLLSTSRAGSKHRAGHHVWTSNVDCQEPIPGCSTSEVGPVRIVQRSLGGPPSCLSRLFVCLGLGSGTLSRAWQSRAGIALPEPWLRSQQRVIYLTAKAVLEDSHRIL